MKTGNNQPDPARRRPRIFDGFCFFNEIDVLRLRLETLWDVVDEFIIVESTFTHAGNRKPLFYHEEDFREFSSKIRYVVIDPDPTDLADHWCNENRQRNGIAQGLGHAHADDWLLVSDVDEIPDPKSIRSYTPSKFFRGVFEQQYYAYFLNNCSVDRGGDPIPWLGTKVTTVGYLRGYFGSVQEVRIFKSKGPWRAFKRKWLELFATQRISPGGWHFSWMTGVDGVIKKLESFAHQEFNKDDLKNRAAISARICRGEDVLGLGARFRVMQLDDTFPAPLSKNSGVYHHLFAPTESA
jgi:beta-1,4-mannosyl-glycoprotein beta-1,4-N-acetylglucosaminyltransferase